MKNKKFKLINYLLSIKSVKYLILSSLVIQSKSSNERRKEGVSKNYKKIIKK
jgi:hypothetical protein